MLTAILFAITMAPPAMPLHCVVTAEDVDKPNAVIDYKGVRYITCCGGCKAPFMKDPETVLKSEKTKGVLIGESLFDVTTGLRIEAKKAKAFEDFGGVRYYFATEKGKAEFDIDPKKATARPEKELVFCPVMGHALKAVADSGGYIDKGGVRFYACCADCMDKLKTDATAFTAKYADKAVVATAVEAPAKKESN